MESSSSTSGSLDPAARTYPGGAFWRVIRRWYYGTGTNASPSGAQRERMKDLLEVFERTYRDELPALFVVVSWGCTATKWLASVLNAHPDIFAVHHMRSHLRMVVPETDALSDYEYLRMLRQLGAGHLLAGDIHGIPIGTVPALTGWFGDRIRTAAVVRHPEKRLLSQVRLFEEFAYSEQVWGAMDYLESLNGFEQVAHLAVGRKKRCFAHAVYMLNNVIQEAQCCRIFRSEDLTTDSSEPLPRLRIAHLRQCDRCRRRIRFGRAKEAPGERSPRERNPGGADRSSLADGDHPRYRQT